jgi:hypothetical protein
MDRARYDNMMATNAALASRVRLLDAQNLARDPNYVPPGMDADMQYNEDYVPSSGFHLSGLFCFGMVVVLIMVCMIGWVFVANASEGLH